MNQISFKHSQLRLGVIWTTCLLQRLIFRSFYRGIDNLHVYLSPPIGKSKSKICFVFHIFKPVSGRSLFVSVCVFVSRMLSWHSLYDCLLTVQTISSVLTLFCLLIATEWVFWVGGLGKIRYSVDCGAKIWVAASGAAGLESKILM